MRIIAPITMGIPAIAAIASWATLSPRRAVRELGRLDVLVSNAAWQNRKESLEEITEDEWHRTFRTNIDAYFYLAKAAIPHRDRASGDGRVDDRRVIESHKAAGQDCTHG